MPVPAQREWYWNSKTKNWRPRRPEERGWGRHCEVVISSLGLANPQWTPTVDLAPAWMRFGFSLFAALEPLGVVLEVFPTASYAQLAQFHEPLLSLSFAGFDAGPKDMLDAYVAAATIREYDSGRGALVGGGDQLGGIVLPKPVPSEPAQLFAWP